MGMKLVDLGRVVGADGAAGKSAYQSAVEVGYTGTEAEFYAALVSLQNAPFLPLTGGDMSGAIKAKLAKLDTLNLLSQHEHSIYAFANYSSLKLLKTSQRQEVDPTEWDAFVDSAIAYYKKTAGNAAGFVYDLTDAKLQDVLRLRKGANDLDAITADEMFVGDKTDLLWQMMSALHTSSRKSYFITGPVTNRKWVNKPTWAEFQYVLLHLNDVGVGWVMPNTEECAAWATPQNVPWVYDNNPVNISNVETPTEDDQAANKKYVDDAVANVGGDFATKEYVENLVEQVKSEAFKAAEKIACLVETINGTERRTNLKLTSFALANEDYALTCNGTIPINTGQYVRLEPPPGYAFTGLAHTWVPALKIGGTFRIGTLNADGAITFTLQKSDVGQSFAFVSMDTGSAPARFILEVA